MVGAHLTPGGDAPGSAAQLNHKTHLTASIAPLLRNLPSQQRCIRTARFSFSLWAVTKAGQQGVVQKPTSAPAPSGLKGFKLSAAICAPSPKD